MSLIKIIKESGIWNQISMKVSEHLLLIFIFNWQKSDE